MWLATQDNELMIACMHAYADYMYADWAFQVSLHAYIRIHTCIYMFCFYMFMRHVASYMHNPLQVSPRSHMCRLVSLYKL